MKLVLLVAHTMDGEPQHRFVAHRIAEAYPQELKAIVAATGIRSRLASLTGRPAVTIPLVSLPGGGGALSLPGQLEDYTAVAGPTWRNEIDADITAHLATFRPARDAPNVRCPVLMQIADFDHSAPPHSAAAAGFAARAEVRHYPCDHFGLFAGHRAFDDAVEHQVSFLTRHLGPGNTESVRPSPEHRIASTTQG